MKQSIAPKFHRKGKFLDALAVLLLMLVMAFLGCAVVLLSAPARADTDNVAFAYAATYGGAVCAVLDDYPSFDGIIGIGQSIHGDGLSYAQAGEVIFLAAQEICPRHLPLVTRFAAAYGDTARHSA